MKTRSTDADKCLLFAFRDSRVLHVLATVRVVRVH